MLWYVIFKVLKLKTLHCSDFFCVLQFWIRWFVPGNEPSLTIENGLLIFRKKMLVCLSFTLWKSFFFILVTCKFSSPYCPIFIFVSNLLTSSLFRCWQCDFVLLIGVDVGDRWKVLQDTCDVYIHEHGSIFIEGNLMFTSCHSDDREKRNAQLQSLKQYGRYVENVISYM